MLRQFGPGIQWVESYVADNKMFRVYLAEDEAIIRKQAEISGFPATKITAVKTMIDPTTAAGSELLSQQAARTPPCDKYSKPASRIIGSVALT